MSTSSTIHINDILNGKYIPTLFSSLKNQPKRVELEGNRMQHMSCDFSAAESRVADLVEHEKLQASTAASHRCTWIHLLFHSQQVPTKGMRCKLNAFEA